MPLGLLVVETFQNNPIRKREDHIGIRFPQLTADFFHTRRNYRDDNISVRCQGKERGNRVERIISEKCYYLPRGYHEVVQQGGDFCDPIQKFPVGVSPVPVYYCGLPAVFIEAFLDPIH